MPNRGIALNATGESGGGILWPVPPRSHRLFLAANIGVARAITRLKRHSVYAWHPLWTNARLRVEMLLSLTRGS
jgi:hypothetical protein